jgi:hypothetical protein
VVSGGGPGNLQWDAHDDIEENHLRKAAETDKPVAGLLKDLKRRGLLDSTLVLWGGEFGRSRKRNPVKAAITTISGFSCGWPEAASKADEVVGATDALGLRAVESPYHFRDIHATILHQLGLDQHHLRFPHLGRDERLTFIEGNLIKQII